VIWAVVAYVLFRLNLLTGDMDKINQVFNSYGDNKVLIFITLSSLRVAALIPSAVFMIMGGMLFNPLVGVLLTLISVIISETIVYTTSKILIGSQMQGNLVKKYPKLYESILRNNKKILAIGILCPIAPSDLTCFLASSTGLNYRKFILTAVIANLPMVILYSFLGNNILSSAGNTIIVVVIIAAISIYSIYLWNKSQRVQRFA
jgi:uncharacterized membrane protein YdjX (TVP38/TMEM64 family)